MRSGGAVYGGEVFGAISPHFDEGNFSAGVFVAPAEIPSGYYDRIAAFAEDVENGKPSEIGERENRQRAAALVLLGKSGFHGSISFQAFAGVIM